MYMFSVLRSTEPSLDFEELFHRLGDGDAKATEILGGYAIIPKFTHEKELMPPGKSPRF